jgi:hypothetical protein
MSTTAQLNPMTLIATPVSTGRRRYRVRRSVASGVGVGNCGISAVLDDGRDINNYCTKVDIFGIRQ